MDWFERILHGMTGQMPKQFQLIDLNRLTLHQNDHHQRLSTSTNLHTCSWLVLHHSNYNESRAIKCINWIVLMVIWVSRFKHVNQFNISIHIIARKISILDSVADALIAPEHKQWLLQIPKLKENSNGTWHCLVWAFQFSVEWQRAAAIHWRNSNWLIYST